MKVYAIRKVLVVDDDEWVHSGIASVLEEHFDPMIEVVGAFTAQAGFSAFFSEAPDIVFVDIHFGEDNTDGIELLQRVKRIGATSKIPFVLFSDRDSLSDQLAGLDEESMPDDFLSKPLPESELVAKIRQWDRDRKSVV